MKLKRVKYTGYGKFITSTDRSIKRITFLSSEYYGIIIYAKVHNMYADHDIEDHEYFRDVYRMRCIRAVLNGEDGA